MCGRERDGSVDTFLGYRFFGASLRGVGHGLALLSSQSKVGDGQGATIQADEGHGGGLVASLTPQSEGATCQES